MFWNLVAAAVMLVLLASGWIMVAGIINVPLLWLPGLFITLLGLRVYQPAKQLANISLVGLGLAVIFAVGGITSVLLFQVGV